MRFVVSTTFQSSSGMRTSGVEAPVPADATAMCNPPSSSVARATAFSTLDSSVTSHVTHCTGASPSASSSPAASLQAILATPGDGDACTVAHQMACACQADTGRTTGDEGGLTCERKFFELIRRNLRCDRVTDHSAPRRRR